ncbi:hypothetical protein DPMN_123398 [Dreissena polymorpha]|uniref:Uncharacterized protein n=1 Tax=Dreissena polymorpha TaxID=45954 RepID=A0A9D4GRH9_DREPO|nr:hypothetical protein DPMN_123398 [Dreissena polymorpha]
MRVTVGQCISSVTSVNPLSWRMCNVMRQGFDSDKLVPVKYGIRVVPSIISPFFHQGRVFKDMYVPRCLVIMALHPLAAAANIECKCCTEYPELMERMDEAGVKCITGHTGFHANCLHPDVIEGLFYEK